MDDLIERLQAGCVYRPKRWSGDTHDDLGGSIDEAATESLLAEAAYALEAAREDAARWRHARKLLTIDDIEGAQGSFDSFGGLISEDECVRADAAIDAAREARNG